MVTIGDSFSIVATLAGLALTFWCFAIACALLFPTKVGAARAAISLRAASCGTTGILALLIGVFGFVALSTSNPLAKFIGLMLIAGYLALVALGSAGISMVAGERLSQLKNEQTNSFDSFAKASFYIVVAGMLPILGWFLFAPAYILFAGGAGLKAVAARQTATQTVV